MRLFSARKYRRHQWVSYGITNPTVAQLRQVSLYGARYVFLGATSLDLLANQPTASVPTREHVLAIPGDPFEGRVLTVPVGGDARSRSLPRLAGDGIEYVAHSLEPFDSFLYWHAAIEDAQDHHRVQAFLRYESHSEPTGGSQQVLLALLPATSAAGLVEFAADVDRRLANDRRRAQQQRLHQDIDEVRALARAEVDRIVDISATYVVIDRAPDEPWTFEFRSRRSKSPVARVQVGYDGGELVSRLVFVDT